MFEARAHKNKAPCPRVLKVGRCMTPKIQVTRVTTAGDLTVHEIQRRRNDSDEGNLILTYYSTYSKTVMTHGPTKF